jgi:hypothetical protein
MTDWYPYVMKHEIKTSLSTGNWTIVHMLTHVLVHVDVNILINVLILIHVLVLVNVCTCMQT